VLSGAGLLVAALRLDSWPISPAAIFVQWRWRRCVRVAGRLSRQMCDGRPSSVRKVSSA
jgi:hypothetical protein